ncbi:MAG TPA: putative metal-dependent hydrolase [Phnomibacter sp.]|nr:putative metal-dependent hydrolase [Phnomibacter sp.]
MQALQYPIGPYEPQPFNEYLRNKWIIDIAQLPALLEAAIQNLDQSQLETPYRPGGWTVAQVVHHVADSHINCYCRLKLTLTEDNPIIRPYEEGLWVKQPDAQLPINNALTLLHALHARMHAIWQQVHGSTWQRTYVHPATQSQHTLWYLLGMYAWHGRHHTAHITNLRQRMGW